MIDARSRASLLVAPLVVAGLAWLGYWRVLHAPFVFDDELFVSSPLTHATSWQAALSVIPLEVSRALTRASFALNFVVGDLDPFGYHLVNVALHALNGILCWSLTSSLLARLGADHPWRSHRHAIALVAAAIWVAHPVQTQAVTYAWQRATLLAASFGLLTLQAYVWARVGRGARRAAWFAVAGVSLLAAMVSKESAGALPGALALLEIVFLRQMSRPGVCSRASRVWSVAVVAASLIGVGLAAWNYLGPRFVTMMAADYQRRGFGPVERLLTESRVVLHYISLLVWPAPGRLTLDYDLPLSRSLVDPPVTLAAVVTVVLLVGVGLWALGRRRLLACPILWYFGLLAIESTVVPLDLVAEHRVYLPSLMPIVFLTAWLWARPTSGRWLASAAAGAVVIALLVATWHRNEVWRDPVRLWQDTAAKSPSKARVRVNLARALLEARQPDDAWREYWAAYRLDPRLVESLNGAATVLVDHRQDLAGAARLVEHVLRVSPEYLPALNNRGVIEMRSGRLAEANATFTAILDRDPHHPGALYNLAAVLLNAGDPAGALQVVVRGLAVWPRDARLHTLHGLVRLQQGDLAGARDAVQYALRRAPGDATAGAALREVERREQAARRGPHSSGTTSPRGSDSR